MKKYLMLFWLLISAPVWSGESPLLQDMQGQSRTLADYTGKGKWTVVMLWVSDCLICNKEAKSYEQFHQKHKSKDATVLGISLDGISDKANAEKFIKQHKLTFPNLIGDHERVALMYVDMAGAEWVGTPSFMIFNPQGKLKAADAGAIPVEVIEEFIATQSK